MMFVIPPSIRQELEPFDRQIARVLERFGATPNQLGQYLYTGNFRELVAEWESEQNANLPEDDSWYKHMYPLVVATDEDVLRHLSEAKVSPMAAIYIEERLDGIRDEKFENAIRRGGNGILMRLMISELTEVVQRAGEAIGNKITLAAEKFCDPDWAFDSRDLLLETDESRLFRADHGMDKYDAVDDLHSCLKTGSVDD